MRNHKWTWGVAVALAAVTVFAAWVTGNLDHGWIVRAGGLVGIGALVSIGWSQRERELDEEVAMELLMAKGIRLYRETDSRH